MATQTAALQISETSRLARPALRLAANARLVALAVMATTTATVELLEVTPDGST